VFAAQNEATLATIGVSFISISYVHICISYTCIYSCKQTHDFYDVVAEQNEAKLAILGLNSVCVYICYMNICMYIYTGVL